MRGVEPERELAAWQADQDAPRAAVTCMAGVEAEAIRWLWPGRVPMGKLCLFVGAPGIGKSFVSLDIAPHHGKPNCWGWSLDPNGEKRKGRSRMARVFRHSYRRKRADGRRKTRTCTKWHIEHTDASWRVRRVPGYTDKSATEAYANELQRLADRERAGIIDRESLNVSQALTAGIERHIDVYRTHLRASGVSAWHLSETTRRLRRVVKDCGFARLLDIAAEGVQRWVTLRLAENMGPRTLNTYTGSLRAFVRWCIADGRMASDPLVTLVKADEATDVRRERRALTEPEFGELLAVAERRPLVDAMTIRADRERANYRLR